MGGYPSDYYVMPDHQVRLTDDRNKVMFKQPLPLVDKEDLDIQVQDNLICLDFNPEKKNPVHKCITLRYDMDPDTAKASFRDGVLTVTADFEKSDTGKTLQLA